MVFEWDEAKRKENLIKHGYDFADAYLVYDNPFKVKVPTRRRDEDRLMDIALVKADGNNILALVYMERDSAVRVISFRRASRKERQLYEQG